MMSDCKNNGFRADIQDHYRIRKPSQHYPFDAACTVLAAKCDERHDVCFKQVERRLHSILKIPPETGTMLLIPSCRLSDFLDRSAEGTHPSH